MTSMALNRSRSMWTDTVVVVSAADTHATYLAPSDQPAPAVKSPAEEEAERWVAQMMFEQYND